jgi:hypothetical protein
MYPTHMPPPETTAADVFSAFRIGFDLMPQRINSNLIVKTIAENPMNRLDMLLSGMLEFVDTLPSEEAIRQVRATVYGVAAMLDGIDIVP